jgi:type IV pilus assembly protein PilC
MMYRYVAYSADKRIIHGNIESDSPETAQSILYKAGFKRILTLKPNNTALDLSRLFSHTPKVSRESLLDFTTELTVLIASGLTLLSALKQLDKQTKNKDLKDIIGQLANNLKGGMPFHQALSLHSQVFSESYTSIIEANEKAGTLEAGFQQIARQLKQQINTRSQIQKAFLQPAIVLGLAFVVVIILAVVVLPPLTDVMKQFGGQLPWTTRMIIAVSNFFSQFKIHIALCVMGLAFIGFVLMKRPASKPLMDKLSLKIPFIGQVIIWNNTAQISRMLSNLLGAGILLPDSISIILRGIPNTSFRASLEDIRKQLVQGRSFSDSINHNRLFPQLLVEMIGVGEISGNLEESLGTVADYYENKVEKRINRLTSLLEPALILGVGLVVGLIAISMISSIYGMMGNFK